MLGATSSSDARYQIFYESQDHFYRIRKPIAAYVRAQSAAPPSLPAVALAYIELHQGVKKHLDRFPSDIFHKATRELVATLTYLWRVGNSNAGDPPFDPLEAPECVVRLLYSYFTAPFSTFLERRHELLPGGKLLPPQI